MIPAWPIVIGAAVVTVIVGAVWLAKRASREDFLLFVSAAQETLEPLFREHGFSAEYDDLGRGMIAHFFNDDVAFRIAFDHVEGILEFDVLQLPLTDLSSQDRLWQMSSGSSSCRAVAFIGCDGTIRDEIHTRNLADCRPNFARWREALRQCGDLLFSGSRAAISERIEQRK